MAKEEASRYEVVITATAEIYFYELAEYLYEHMAFDRAEEITREIHEAVLSLGLLYRRGKRENKLAGRKFDYRYILYKRTPRAEIKIIYFISEKEKTVYVTDFFPTEKNPTKISKRNR